MRIIYISFLSSTFYYPLFIVHCPSSIVLLFPRACLELFQRCCPSFVDGIGVLVGRLPKLDVLFHKGLKDINYSGILMQLALVSSHIYRRYISAHLFQTGASSLEAVESIDELGTVYFKSLSRPGLGLQDKIFVSLSYEGQFIYVRDREIEMFEIFEAFCFPSLGDCRIHRITGSSEDDGNTESKLISQLDTHHLILEMIFRFVVLEQLTAFLQISTDIEHLIYHLFDTLHRLIADDTVSLAKFFTDFDTVHPSSGFITDLFA